MEGVLDIRNRGPCERREAGLNMNTDKEYSSFTGAMADFFGKKEGQSLAEFGQELKALTPETKAFFLGYRFVASVG